MFITNVKDLEVGQTVQYIGNTCDLFGKIMKVHAINPDKNQCHIIAGDHYLTRCDAENILVLQNAPKCRETDTLSGMTSVSYTEYLEEKKFIAKKTSEQLGFSIADVNSMLRDAEVRAGTTYATAYENLLNDLDAVASIWDGRPITNLNDGVS